MTPESRNEMLLERINEALSDGDILTTTRIRMPEPMELRIQVIVTATGVDQESNETCQTRNFGSWCLAEQTFKTIHDLTDRLREILMETDTTMDDRSMEWSEYYDSDEIDHEGHAPCHPEYNHETTPPMLEKHGWPETHEDLCTQAEQGGLTSYQRRNFGKRKKKKQAGGNK